MTARDSRRQVTLANEITGNREVIGGSIPPCAILISTTMKRTITILIDSPAANGAADYVEKFREHICQAADEFCEDNIPDFEITFNICPAQLA